MEISISNKVKEWLAQPDSEGKSESVMLAIEGYMAASAGVKQFRPQGKPMFIMNIGRNDAIEREAKEALDELQIPVKQSQGGTMTLEVTRAQLQSVLATNKFRSARLSSERSVQPGGL